MPIRPNHRHGFNASGCYDIIIIIIIIIILVDFWASLQIARQCQGIVGHIGSAAFRMILYTVCYNHDNKFIQCPPYYDVSAESI